MHARENLPLSHGRRGHSGMKTARLFFGYSLLEMLKPIGARERMTQCAPYPTIEVQSQMEDENWLKFITPSLSRSSPRFSPPGSKPGVAETWPSERSKTFGTFWKRCVNKRSSCRLANGHEVRCAEILEVGLGTLRNFRRRTAAAIRQLEDIQPVEKLFGGGADHRLPQRTPSTSRSSPRSRSNAPNISPHRHALDSVLGLDQDHLVGLYTPA